MDDLIVKVVVRLARVYESLGERAYRDAAHRALIGIGRAAVDEAERRATAHGPASTFVPTTVLKFPLERARHPEEFGDGEKGD